MNPARTEPQIYRHPPLGEDVDAAGGRYRLEAERCAEVDGREVLYTIATAELDTSCCGASGWTYAIVAGFVAALRFGRDRDGCDLSRIEPIADPAVRDRVRRAIEAREGVSQVTFR